MKEFFAKYGGKYQDPYEAIELIGHKLHQIKDKVAKADPSHIKDLSAISDMIDDYVNSIKDGDLKPVQVGQEYQDHKMRGNRWDMNDYRGRDNYPGYREDHQRNDHMSHERGRSSGRGHDDRDFDDYRDGMSNPRR